MKKAAIYARKSKKKDKPGAIVVSIEDQIRVCTARARQLRVPVVSTYEDNRTGGALLNRPGFLALYEAAKRKEFDVLLLDELTRLARMIELPRVIEQFVACGVVVIALDGFDSRLPNSKIQSGMIGVFGEHYRDFIAEKVLNSAKGRAERGESIVALPYGYLCKDRKRTVIDAQARIIRGIFERYVRGDGVRKIALELTAANVPPPRGSKWMGTTVFRMLSNVTYNGDIVWNRHSYKLDAQTGRRVRKAKAAEEVITRHIESLRIVDAKLFAAVQAKLHARHLNNGAGRSGGRARFLLSGLLRCKVCGCNYLLDGKKGYRCANVVRNGVGACTNNRALPQAALEETLVGDLNRQLLAPEVVKQMATEMQRELNARIKEQRAASAERPQALRELEERIARLKKRLAKGDPDLTTDELQAAIVQVESKRDALAARPASAAGNVAQVLPKAAAVYRQKIERALAGKDVATTSEARTMLLGMFGGQIVVTPGKKDGEVWGEFALQPAQMLRAIQPQATR